MLNSEEIRVAPFGRVLVSDVGASVPTDLESDYSSDWFEFGYLSEDGVTFDPTLDIQKYNVWQGRLPAKIMATDLAFTAAFTMSQMNSGTTSVYFFDAEWTESEPGVYSLDVASDQLLKERALSVEWTDDAGYINRLTIPRGFVSNRESLQLQRNNVSDMGITFEALDYNGKAFNMLSNNPAFEPISIGS